MTLCPWRRFLKVAVLGGVAVVELSDRVLRASYRPWLVGMARDLPGCEFRLDFDEVRSLSDAALGTLLTFHKEVKARGGRLQLCNLSPSLHESLTTNTGR